jgi:hypothetical protein
MPPKKKRVAIGRVFSAATNLFKDAGKSYIYTRLYQHINQNNILATEQ